MNLVAVLFSPSPLLPIYIQGIFFLTIRCSSYTLYSDCYIQVMHLDAEKEMMSQCVALLGKFIAVREPNIRYLGLVSRGAYLINPYFSFLVLLFLFEGGTRIACPISAVDFIIIVEGLVVVVVVIMQCPSS